MSSQPEITHFIAHNNAVIGLTEEGAATNEPRYLVCLCYGVPGLGQYGADVAKVIAELLNAQPIHGIAFSLPNDKEDAHG